jgi:ElaB/YqjD/DUF883 family membrane-anchored ribosome-binding protein
MKTQTAAIRDDMGTLVEDARALMIATADVGGEKVKEARKRLAATLDGTEGIVARVRDRAIERAKAANEAVHKHPFQVIAIGLGVGTLIGYLLGQRCCHHRD